MKRKRYWILAVGILWLGWQGAVWGEDWSLWSHVAEVSQPRSNEPFCRLLLSGEVYHLSRGDLADVRLVDRTGGQIPYVLYRPQDEVKRQECRLIELNRGVMEDGSAVLTLDFDSQVMKDQIAVETSGTNFRRKIVAEGSNDNREFITLVDGAYVFAIPGQSGIQRFSSLRLPANDFRYLRIRVYPMTAEEGVITIGRVTAWQEHSKRVGRQPVVMKLMVGGMEDKTKTSWQVYDLEYNHLPVVGIRLEAAEERFYRYVTIEGREQEKIQVEIHGEDNRRRYRDEEVPWRHLRSGTIYRYSMTTGQVEESLRLSLPEGAVPRYIRISIRNYDDQPMTVESAEGEMIPHQLLFARQDEVCLLYTGNPSVAAPRYDLEQTLSQPMKIPAADVTSSGMKPNPVFAIKPAKVVPWTEQHKILLWVTLILMVTVLGGFIIKSWKTITSRPGE